MFGASDVQKTIIFVSVKRFSFCYWFVVFHVNFKQILSRRSVRLRQVSSQPASTVIASPSSTESIAGADANVTDVVIQPKLKEMKLISDEDDPIAPFLLLPVEVLEQIFIKVDDFGLLNLADTCTRFESIALAVVSNRYADRYFVINW